MTDDEQDYVNDLKWSKLPVWLTAYGIAAARAGKSVRNRDDMVPNVLSQKGLYIDCKSALSKAYIYGDIGGDHGITGQDFQSALASIDSKAPMELHVHSPGGDFREGVAIYNQIRNRAGEVRGFVDGEAASAGSLILMPCASITMSPGSTKMVHFASVSNTRSWGETDLAKALKLVQETNEKLIGFYRPRWKGSEKQLRAVLEAETYYSGTEAVQVGLADYVDEQLKVASYKAMSDRYRANEFAISASGKLKQSFFMERASLRLWQIEADVMEREIGVYS